tara:strand:+ start:1233 stop:2345 length:1113 start_codon:yes stop_codon:yes gene_type:complete
MPHIMIGQSIAFTIDGNGNRSNFYNLGNVFNNNAFFFITEDRDSSYMANFFTVFDSNGNAVYLNGASPNSVSANLDRVIWSNLHFSYLEHIPSLSSDTKGTTSISLNKYDVLVNGGKNSSLVPFIDEDKYTITTFSPNLSQAPIFTIKNSTYPTLGNGVFLKYGNHSYRILFPFADTTGIYLRELIYCSDVTVPSATITNINFQIVNTTSDFVNGVNHPVADHSSFSNVVEMTPNRVRIGTGSFNPDTGTFKALFDSDNNYLKKDNSGDVQFYTNMSYTLEFGLNDNLWNGLYGSSQGGYPLNGVEKDGWKFKMTAKKNGSVIASEDSQPTASIVVQIPKQTVGGITTGATALQSFVSSGNDGDCITYDI